jgi:ABC-type branched-subunit amino acid transport system substrate-binding protein
MRHTLFSVILSLLLLTVQSFSQSRIQYAADDFRKGDYVSARQTLKNLIYAPGEDQEAAMYLMLRIELAESNGQEALSVADRLLSLFPRGGYAQYAHFSRAEAFYLLQQPDAAREELTWVSRNATDRRLNPEVERALASIQGETKIENATAETPLVFDPIPASGRYTLKEGRVVLLLSFPDPDDPAAADLQRGFRYAADYGSFPYPATIVKVASPLEAAGAARDLMSDDKLLLLLFAGDEGSAMTVTLLSREYGVPVIKLNSSAKSFTEFSPMVHEFLPSTFTQAEALGKYATEALNNDFTLILSPEDEDGRAGKDGFMQGVISQKGTVDAVVSYPPSATSVRRELADLFSAAPRMARGESPLKSVLSREEREQLFGDKNAGEVLGENSAEPAYEDTITTREAFYFSLTPENIDNFASQLSAIPIRTTLFGNSSWIDYSALERQTSVTNGMYIAVPLLPSVSDTLTYVDGYVKATGAPPGAWELLGIDAGEFTGGIMNKQPNSRKQIVDLLVQSDPYYGLSVNVRFSKDRENNFARILRHSDGELTTIR